MQVSIASEKVIEVESHGDVAVIWTDRPPVNALSWELLGQLVEALQQALRDPQTRGVVFACRGRTFFAGAEIRELERPAGGRPDLVNAIAHAGKPVVAAIFGSAFGGGLEVGLSCHARVAERSARFAFPEVKLGILPAEGGGSRLARLVGVEKALDMLTVGEPIGADEALAIGLVDALADQAQLCETAVATARRLAAGGELRRTHELDAKLAAVRADRDFFAQYREKLAARSRGQQAPERIVQCMEATVHESFEAASALEVRVFRELVASEQSKALRYYFFAERTAAKVPDVPRDMPQRPVLKAGVIGAGTMGGGIAMCFANAGIPVTVIEREQAVLERGLGVVRKNYERSAQRGRFSATEAAERMGRIHGALALETLADCDMVVEAVFENLGIKQELFARLDAICKPGAILASNTSGLDLNQIAASTARPADVIGTHFFSPANVMKLLEVVRGQHTALDVIATVMALSKTLDKVPALVGVCPGFVANRIMGRRGQQVQKLLLQGALPWDVDRVLCDFGFPMGPFATADLAGLDIGWNAAKSRGQTIRDRLCEMGRRGQKTGAGYYNYDPETRARTPEPKVAELIAEFARDKGIPQRRLSDQEIIDRCVLAVINEGAKVLQEGIAIRASDIDVILVNGYSWPKHRGGPMYQADAMGLSNVVTALQRLAEQDAEPQWQPAPLLTRMAAEGRTFTQ